MRHAEGQEVRTKTPNGHFSDFSDEQGGESPLEEVAKDAVEVEEATSTEEVGASPLQKKQPRWFQRH